MVISYVSRRNNQTEHGSSLSQDFSQFQVKTCLTPWPKNQKSEAGLDLNKPKIKLDSLLRFSKT